MLKKWLKDTSVRCKEYHLDFIGFERALKSFRLDSSDWIESKLEITLPFAVQINILDHFNLG